MHHKTFSNSLVSKRLQCLLLSQNAIPFAALRGSLCEHPSASTCIIIDQWGRRSNPGSDLLLDTADAIDITKARFPGTRSTDIREDVFQRGTLTAPPRKATFSQINKLLKVLFLGFDPACWELERVPITSSHSDAEDDKCSFESWWTEQDGILALEWGVRIPKEKWKKGDVALINAGELWYTADGAYKSCFAFNLRVDVQKTHLIKTNAVNSAAISFPSIIN